MKLLTLIRHAKSSWDHPGLSDFERPLNARGERDLPGLVELAIDQWPGLTRGCGRLLIFDYPKLH